MDRSASPLNGIRVIDLTQYAPGPYTTKLLCDLGAEVLKIEPPAGDPLRRMFCANNSADSPVYQSINRGKIVTKIDLKNPQEQLRVLEIIAMADVLLESYRPGVVDKLGINYEQCRKVNPALVYASLSGYGQDGPYRNRSGHDINYAAAAGLLSSVTPDRPFFPLVADHTGAMNAVNAILSALVAKQRTAKGCYLDLSLYEAMLGWQYFNQSIPQDDKASLGLLTGGAACYQLYQTEDNRVVTLGALEPHFWGNFCEAVGHPEWVQRQFDPMPQQQLIAAVGKLFSAASLHYWTELLGSVDCCFEPVPLEHEIYHHPQTVARNLVSDGQHAFAGKMDGQNLCVSAGLYELPKGQLPDWQKTKEPLNKS